MKKLLVALSVCLQTLNVSAQIPELWIIVAETQISGVKVEMDINTFGIRQGKTLEDTMISARIKITDAHAPKKNEQQQYGIAVVNLNACFNKAGNIGLLKETQGPNQRGVYQWRSKGPSVIDGMGEALCSIYDTSQKRK